MTIPDAFVKQQWTQFLRTLLADYRREFPEDTRSDSEVLYALLERLHKAGRIGKVDGKFIQPTIMDDTQLL